MVASAHQSGDAATSQQVDLSFSERTIQDMFLLSLIQDTFSHNTCLICLRNANDSKYVFTQYMVDMFIKRQANLWVLK